MRRDDLSKMITHRISMTNQDKSECSNCGEVTRLVDDKEICLSCFIELIQQNPTPKQEQDDG